uniref:Uncharacterized protein n=1 Tax=Arundo donax TaxID=35708 RepID=A0A0A9DT11_ARUDO
MSYQIRYQSLEILTLIREKIKNYLPLPLRKNYPEMPLYIFINYQPLSLHKY